MRCTNLLTWFVNGVLNIDLSMSHNSYQIGFNTVEWDLCDTLTCVKISFSLLMLLNLSSISNALSLSQWRAIVVAKMRRNTLRKILIWAAFISKEDYFSASLLILNRYNQRVCLNFSFLYFGCRSIMLCLSD